MSPFQHLHTQCLILSWAQRMAISQGHLLAQRVLKEAVFLREYTIKVETVPIRALTRKDLCLLRRRLAVA